MGCRPLVLLFFCYLSGYTPFAKIPFNYINWNKRPVASLWQNFLPTRNLIFHPIEGVFTHSKPDFSSNRGGFYPLETGYFVRTSGTSPTRNSLFYENEWAVTHSKLLFYQERVGRDPAALLWPLKRQSQKPAVLLPALCNRAILIKLPFFRREFGFSLIVKSIQPFLGVFAGESLVA